MSTLSIHAHPKLSQKPTAAAKSEDKTMSKGSESEKTKSGGVIRCAVKRTATQSSSCRLLTAIPDALFTGASIMRYLTLGDYLQWIRTCHRVRALSRRAASSSSVSSTKVTLRIDRWKATSTSASTASSSSGIIGAQVDNDSQLIRLTRWQPSSLIFPEYKSYWSWRAMLRQNKSTPYASYHPLHELHQHGWYRWLRQLRCDNYDGIRLGDIPQRVLHQLTHLSLKSHLYYTSASILANCTNMVSLCVSLPGWCNTWGAADTSKKKKKRENKPSKQVKKSTSVAAKQKKTLSSSSSTRSWLPVSLTSLSLSFRPSRVSNYGGFMLPSIPVMVSWVAPLINLVSITLVPDLFHNATRVKEYIDTSSAAHNGMAGALLFDVIVSLPQLRSITFVHYAGHRLPLTLFGSLYSTDTRVTTTATAIAARVGATRINHMSLNLEDANPHRNVKGQDGTTDSITIQRLLQVFTGLTSLNAGVGMAPSLVPDLITHLNHMEEKNKAVPVPSSSSSSSSSSSLHAINTRALNEIRLDLTQSVSAFGWTRWHELTHPLLLTRLRAVHIMIDLVNHQLVVAATKIGQHIPALMQLTHLESIMFCTHAAGSFHSDRVMGCDPPTSIPATIAITSPGIRATWPHLQHDNPSLSAPTQPYGDVLAWYGDIQSGRVHRTNVSATKAGGVLFRVQDHKELNTIIGALPSSLFEGFNNTTGTIFAHTTVLDAMTAATATTITRTSADYKSLNVTDGASFLAMITTGTTPTIDAVQATVNLAKARGATITMTMHDIQPSVHEWFPPSWTCIVPAALHIVPPIYIPRYNATIQLQQQQQPSRAAATMAMASSSSSLLEELYLHVTPSKRDFSSDIRLATAIENGSCRVTIAARAPYWMP